MRKLFFYVVSMMFFQWEIAAKDYSYFITEDIRVHASSDGKTFTADPDKIEEAKHAKECRPAEQDPEGNWGEVTNGMQASIRFDKTLFATNEAIVATILMRDVSDELRMIEYPKAFGVSYCIIVVNPENKLLDRKGWADPNTGIGKLQRMIHDYRIENIGPGMQRKLSADLQEFYDFSLPGKYLISVKMKAYPWKSADFKYVQSANAVITISNSPATATNNTAPSPPK